MMRFGTGFSISNLFVTHLHGDHVLGIPGLLQTMAFNDRDAPLAIHPLAARVPAQIAGERPRKSPLVSGADQRNRRRRRPLSRRGYQVRAFDTDHDTRSVGYALVEDDRKGPVRPRVRRRTRRSRRAEVLETPRGRGRRTRDGTVVDPDQVVGDPDRADRSSTPATPVPRRRRSRSPKARPVDPRRDLRRRPGRSGDRHRPLDRPPSRRNREPRRRGSTRAHAPLALRRSHRRSRRTGPRVFAGDPADAFVPDDGRGSRFRIPTASRSVDATVRYRELRITSDQPPGVRWRALEPTERSEGGR